MRLASYKVRGRESFGVVIGEGAGEGVVDLKPRLGPHFANTLDLLRDGGLDLARQTARGRTCSDISVLRCRHSRRCGWHS
jgi:hypothetical protein